MPKQKDEYHIGFIREVKQDKGYGFIVADGDDERRDIFFTYHNIKRWYTRTMPPAGKVVRFQLVPAGVKGKNDRAVNVEVLG